MLSELRPAIERQLGVALRVAGAEEIGKRGEAKAQPGKPQIVFEAA